MDWNRFYELTDLAKALPPADRAAFLDRECSDDHELRQHVLATAGQSPAESFLDPPDISDTTAPHIAKEGVVVGEFKLLREIGAGGMGHVYEAHQQSLGRRVAVKLLSGLPVASERRNKARARFRHEAEILASLSHPALLGVITSGEHEDVPWFAMPLVDGHDVGVEIGRQRAARDGDGGKRRILPPFGTGDYVRAVVELVADAAHALHVAHEAKVIHRDVKSKNLLLSREGQVLVADFGLAKSEAADSLTGAGGMQGTLRYMSPEQMTVGANEKATDSMAGEDADREDVDTKKVDRRTDVYSLGVVLYELLTLRHPYENVAVPALPMKVCAGDHKTIRRVNPRMPRDLAVVVGKAMAVGRGARYETALAFAEDLRRFARFESVKARPPSWHQRVLQWVRKQPRKRFALGGALLASVALLVAMAFWSRYTATREAGATITRGIESLVAEGAVDTPAERERIVQARDVVALRPDHARAAAFTARFSVFHDVHTAKLQAGWKEQVGDGALGGDFALRRGLNADAFTELIEYAVKLQQIFPDDPNIAACVEARDLYPRIHIAQPIGASRDAAVLVRVRQHDLVHGGLLSPRLMGSPPLDLALVEGDWRIEIEVEGQGTLESDLYLRFGDDDIDMVPDLAALGRRPAGMRAIDGCTIDLDSPLTMCCFSAETAELEPYWIGDVEVSNGEYLGFLEATGRELPKFWRWIAEEGDWRTLDGIGTGPDDIVTESEFLELPVSGLSMKEMLAYAEWRGCRLPTHFELECALRGPSMLPELPAGELANIGGERRAKGDFTLATRFRHYLASVRPVREEAYFQSPNGLYHAHGNVYELSSSRMVERVDGRLEVLEHDFYGLGCGWGDALNSNLSQHFKHNRTASEVRLDCGFRLARSR